MKKIVAVVLALVMVLGLSTTAFAAKAGLDSYANATANYDWDVTVSLEDKADDKDATFATYTIEATAKKDDVADFWGAGLTNVEKGDKEDVEINGEDEFVKVADEAYADIVVVDGKKIEYYAVAADYNEDGWDAEGTKVTLPGMPVDDADYKCNTLYNNAESVPGTFYYSEDVLYVSDEAGDVVLNVGGVAVLASEAELDTDYVYVDHDYQCDYSNKTHATGGDTVTKVYCQNCLCTFKFVQDTVEVAVATFGDDNYQAVDAQNPFLWMELVEPAIPGVSAAAGGSAAGSDAARDKVESAETFDAGIAMYVGMSVMAAAGSAVVLKKKD